MKTALAALVLGMFTASIAAQTTIYVSPDGKNPNTVTLTAAIAQLKSPKLRNADGQPLASITIELSAGTYRLDSTLVLDAASSGSAEHPVVFRGPPDGSAILTGGRPVSNFRPVTDPTVLARLPAVARNHVLTTNLPQQGITDFGEQKRHGFGSDAANPTAIEITQENQPLTLARWPNKGFATIESTPDGEKGLRFTLQAANLAAWQSEPQLLATGYWFNNWADTTLRIANIDTTKKQLNLESPAPPYGIKKGQRIFVQNALAELDSPGEWYLDTPTGNLYLWPIAGTKAEPKNVDASMLTQLLAVNNASHIIFSQLTFQNTRGDSISIQGGHHVRIEKSTIRNIGKRGVYISGEYNGITDTLLENIGTTGITLQGGDRKTLTPGNLYAANSIISNFSRVSRTYQPAILMHGVGNSAIKNKISNAPHSAIIFNGNDHLISENTISDVCLETGDSGVIYTGRNWSARGTIVEKNSIKNIPANISWGRTRGVYLDDQASGITVRENTFFEVNMAVFIGGGRDNTIEKNEFIGGNDQITLDARGITWQKEMTNDPNEQLRKSLSAVPYQSDLYKNKYPHLAELLSDEPGKPKYNSIRKNIFIGPRNLKIDENAVSGISIE